MIKLLIVSLRRNIMTILMLMIAFYLGYHMVMGNRGLISLVRLENELNKSKQELESLKKEEKDLNHKISLIRDNDNLSKDFLEEKAIENGINPPDAITMFKK